MFQVKVKKSRLRINLIFAIVFLVLVVSVYIFTDNPNSFFLFYLLLSAIYFWRYFYERSKPYIEINDDNIIKNSFLSTKRIPIDDINSIKNVFGDVVISSDEATIKIVKNLIEREVHSELEDKLTGIKEERGI